MLSRLFVFALALSSTGCFVIPHMDQDAPAIRGTVTQSGKRAAGVRVRRRIDVGRDKLGDCGGDVLARTGEDGAFALPASKYFTPVMIFGDRMDSWGICFELPSGGRAVWLDGGWFGGPPAQRLDCELGSPAPGSPVTLERASADRPGCTRVDLR
jgi:hypothetical protein